MQCNTIRYDAIDIYHSIFLLQLFEEISKYVCILSLPNTTWADAFEILYSWKTGSNLHCQKYNFWWPNDANIQGLNGHGVESIFQIIFRFYHQMSLLKEIAINKYFEW